ncbi:hypothetical protein BsWGS_08129 [Bradybaena similaris]
MERRWGCQKGDEVNSMMMMMMMVTIIIIIIITIIIIIIIIILVISIVMILIINVVIIIIIFATIVIITCLAEWRRRSCQSPDFGPVCCTSITWMILPHVRPGQKDVNLSAFSKGTRFYTVIRSESI